MLEERALPEFKAALLLRPKTDKMGCSGPRVEPFRRERQRRVIRQISREDRKLLLAVEYARAKPLAFDWHANDAGKAVIAYLASASLVTRTLASAKAFTSAPEKDARCTLFLAISCRIASSLS